MKPNTNGIPDTDYFKMWVRQIGEYLKQRFVVEGFSNIVTISDPLAEGRFWAVGYEWNKPIEFHGSRSTTWYADNYYTNYCTARNQAQEEEINNQDPNISFLRPIVDGEPKKYQNNGKASSGLSYGADCSEEGRWNFYIGAMAGGYPTYHSQFAAYDIAILNDVGLSFVDTFSKIMQLENQNQSISTEWYKMYPDFWDFVLDTPYGCNYSGGLTTEMVYPLEKFEEIAPQVYEIEKGFIYLLQPHENTMDSSGDKVFILNDEFFHPGSKYQFTWYLTDSTDGLQQERCIGPGSRFVEIPQAVRDRLNEVKIQDPPEPTFTPLPQDRTMQYNRDAILFYKKLDGTFNYEANFKDNFESNTGITLNPDGSIHPGDSVSLDLKIDLKASCPESSLFGVYGLCLAYEGSYFFYPNWNSNAHCIAELIKSSDISVWPSFTMPEIDDVIKGQLIFVILEPQQFAEHPADDNNPGWISQTIAFTCEESYHNRYVRNDGDDHNNGLSPDTAWATLSHAVSAINQASPRPSAEDSYRIYLGSETFFVPDGAFTVSPFTRIEGMGPKKTTIKSATNSGLFFPAGSRNSIVHCTLDRLPIAVSNSELHLYNDYLINCTGTQTSAVYAIEGNLNIKDCLFVSNRYGILESDSQMRVTDCTFNQNRNAIYMNGAPASGSTIITNSIITNSLSSAIKAIDVFPDVTYCCFFNNTVDLEGVARVMEHKTTTNPLFVDPANMNYCLQQTIVDPLQGESPCVDSGREIQVPFDVNYGSTRTDQAPDNCQMDRGYRAVKIKIQSVIGEVDEPDDGGIINKIIEGTKPDEVVIKEDELLGQVIRIIFNNDPCNPVVINPGLIENPNGISMIDVTGDTYNDLIVTTDSGSIIYENDKTGNFIENKSNANGFAHLVNSTMTGDLNQDGKNDLIYCCQDGVRVLLAPLSKKIRPDLYLKSGNVQSASIGVLDSQKKTSLVVIDENGDIQVFFDPFTNSKTQDQVVLEPIYAESLRLIDVNNDGLTDIQVVGSGEEYLNDGNNGFYQTAESTSGVTTQDSARN